MKNVKQYERECPECGDIIYHSSVASRSHCRKNICRKCSDKKKHRANYGKTNGKWEGYGDISLTYFHGVKQNAENRQISFDLTINDVWDKFLEQNKKCVYTGLQLTLPSRTRTGADGTVSVDRIDSSKGYTKNNIQWVHKDINWMKQDFDECYFIEMCKLVNENSVITPIDIFIRNNQVSNS